MINKSLFGTMPDGRKVYNYTFIDSKGQSVTISEYACAIIESKVLAQDGKLYDVTLGYDTLNEYLQDTRNFGAIVGRYANRIALGQFTVNGVTYHLERNNGRNTLHGGDLSFRKKLFTSTLKDNCVEFKLESPDLDCGFPGNFTLIERASFIDGALKMEYEYICDKDTPASITNHNYFNLNGHGNGSILNHELIINAARYCKADNELLAAWPPVSVEGTPFDFRQAKKIIDGIFTYSPELINAKGGYDHCYETPEHDKPAAIMKGDKTGITLEVYSDMPALQFYSGNSIGHTPGKNGAYYNDHEGFALECQQFPNAMNINEPSCPNVIIKAGQLTKCYITYKFACQFFALVSIEAINDSKAALKDLRPSSSNLAQTAFISIPSAANFLRSDSALSRSFSRVKAALP